MTLAARDVTLCIDPFSHHFENDRLFDPSAAAHTGELLQDRFAQLREWFRRRGIAVHTADRLERGEVGSRVNLVMSFGMRGRYRSLARREDVILSAFFAFESPIVEPALYSDLPAVSESFRRVYSFTNGESIAPLMSRPLTLERFSIPYPLEGIRETVWRREDRGFLVMINHNKLPAIAWNELYTERMRALEFFAARGEIDLYGRAWDGPSLQMGIGWLPGSVQHLLRFCQANYQKVRPVPALVAARSVYKGVAASKIETLGHYRYCLCFENGILPGWVTEKLFDCLVAGTIPVYWGAPDIEHLVPREAFIDMRRFGSYEDLRAYLLGLSESDVRSYKEAGRAFLASAGFEPFRTSTFIELLGKIVCDDTGLALEPER